MRFVIVALLLAPLALSTPARAAPGEEAARRSAEVFVRALTTADASKLRPILPSRGKVQLQLVNLGPEKGYFSGSQVEALIREFLSQGSIRSVEPFRVEPGRRGYAVMHTRVELTNRQGRPCSAELHLALQPEGERWVLREIRETPR